MAMATTTNPTNRLVLWLCSPTMAYGALIGLRPSMVKFESETLKLEVCTWSRPIPFFLNRQIIIALFTLGIPRSVFWGKYQRVVAALEHLDDGGDRALEVRTPRPPS